jgi:hypothetical protein
MCAKKPDGYCESSSDCDTGYCDMTKNRCGTAPTPPQPPSPECDGYTIFNRCIPKRVVWFSAAAFVILLIIIIAFLASSKSQAPVEVPTVNSQI